MSLTHFLCVKEFNQQFGHACPNVVDPEVFNTNPKLVKLRYDLIAEEIRELKDGFRNQDMVEAADAMADILYVVHGAGVAFGIDLDQFYVCRYIRPLKINYDIFDKEELLGCECIKIIDRSLRSLEEAFKAKSMELTTHALCNLLYSVYFTGTILGLDLDVLFRIVHDNNMSKLCATEQIARESVIHYATLPGFEHIKVSYRLASDGKHYAVFNADTGKVLKSKYWVEPDFSAYFGAGTNNSI